VRSWLRDARDAPWPSLSSGQLHACASNLQSLVASLALQLGLPEEMQAGLNARDQGLFDAALIALQEVRVWCVCVAGPCDVLLPPANSTTALGRHAPHTPTHRPSKGTCSLSALPLQQPSARGRWQRCKQRWLQHRCVCVCVGGVLRECFCCCTITP
jgi:hypothetical protein